METSTTDPNVMIGLGVFAAVLTAAMVSRWVLNVRQGRESKQKKAATGLPSQ